jgi:phage-related minor tail protein
LMEEELTLKRLGYKADEITARIAELTGQRKEIRDQGDDANDEAVKAARENASNRSAQLVRDHNKQIFDSLKQQAGGVFDALLSKSQSVWSAIGNSLKTALLTAIKDVVTSRIAAMLMNMFAPGSGPQFRSGGGSSLGFLGALGMGAVPAFAGGGAGASGGGTSGFGAGRRRRGGRWFRYWRCQRNHGNAAGRLGEPEIPGRFREHGQG